MECQGKTEGSSQKSTNANSRKCIVYSEGTPEEYRQEASECYRLGAKRLERKKVREVEVDGESIFINAEPLSLNRPEK
jgi:hypothetical protein